MHCVGWLSGHGRPFEVTCDPGPAGEDPELLTHKTDVTADIAGKTQYGQSHAIDHQASAQI